MANVIRESARGIDVIPIEDEMLNSRKIFLVGSVDETSMNELMKKLMYLENKNNKEEIILYINSPGGMVTSGLAVFDYIGIMKSPLKTVCIGDAASMGAILFLAGQKREMLEHTRILIHDPSYGHFDMGGKKPHELQMEVDNLGKVRDTLGKIISERTGKPLKEVYKITANDRYFDAEEAIKFGLATAIYKGE